MIELQREEQRRLSEYVYSVCAISLDESKGYLIQSRLAHLVQETGCGSYRALLERAKSDSTGKLERRIVDAITTNETLFFRDTAPFELLRHKVIPDLIDRRSRQGPVRIRIWSAACSTGQELYSIAIVMKELLGDPYRYGVQLIGTDVSDEAVGRASRGVFSSVEISRGLTESQKSRYFIPVADGWQIRDEIRGMAQFRKWNLMNDFTSLGRFDVIFCRNIAIYFTQPDKVSLFARVARALELDGALIIGAMESLNGICPQLESKRHLRSVFYQRRAGM